MRNVIFGLLIVVSFINLSGVLSEKENAVLNNDVVRFNRACNSFILS